MSNDFKKVLVNDSRLNCTSEVCYAVKKGAQNHTAQQYAATSQTTSSIVFNCQMPSVQTVIDRRVMIKSTVVLKIEVSEGKAGDSAIDYGNTDALAPFPLHSLFSVITATINNNSVSTNIRDTLPAILRFTDDRELNRYNGACPTAYDKHARYQDGVNRVSNVLGGYELVSDNSLQPRGTFNLDKIGSGVANNEVFGEPPVLDDEGKATVFVQFTTTEPLLLSPFLFGNPKYNNQGFYGVSTMNLQCNVADATRVWRASTRNERNTRNVVKICSLVGFKETTLLMNMLSPHPSQILPARNVVPYYSLERYIQGNITEMVSGTSKTINTTTIQLNSIPDKLIIFGRRTEQKNQTTDSFLTIKNISINFNNSSGILASASQYDLYKFSMECGSNQSFQEFTGSVNQYDMDDKTSVKTPTSGSMLMLEFGKHIQLSEDFYSPGSLGSFNLQMKVDVENNLGENITPEIVVITLNSGVFVNEKGTSSVYQGLLNKADVLEASSMENYEQAAQVDRMVGGNFLDSLSSVFRPILNVVKAVSPVLKTLARSSGNQYANAAASVADAVGLGKSGGGSTGGLKHRLH